MRYVHNTETGELHDRHSAGERCNLDDAKHAKAVDLTEFEQLIRDGADLCDWCFGDDRHGKWITSPAEADSISSTPDSDSA